MSEKLTFIHEGLEHKGKLYNLGERWSDDLRADLAKVVKDVLFNNKQNNSSTQKPGR